MLFKAFFCSLLLIYFASFSQAGIIKGNLGGRNTRTIPLSLDGPDQIISFTLLFDNGQSDLDVYVVTDTPGQTSTIVCSSVTFIKNFESCECGLNSNDDYKILIQHFSGPSTAFRFFVATAISVTGAPSSTQSVFVDEQDPWFGTPPAKVMDQIKKLEQSKKRGLAR